MVVDLVSKEDLANFRIQLVNDFKEILRQEKLVPPTSASKSGYKTRQVKEMLQCSTNTLNLLRIKRNIRTKKIGGSLYYNPEDIRKILEDGFNINYARLLKLFERGNAM